MKIYDKEMYNKQESLRTVVLMIIVFLVGFFAGYMANSLNHSNSNKIQNETSILIENKV